MELQEVIATRRTIRDFSNEPVAAEIMNRALKAGLKAPSYNHLKQWDFILVKDQQVRIAITQTERMSDEISAEQQHAFADYDSLAKGMYLEAIPKQRRMILSAPELLVIVYRPKTLINESQRVYDLNCLASVWCCIQNILLTLAEHNVFGVTFVPQNTPAVKKVLAIPSDLEVAAIIPLGYKATNTRIIPQKEVLLEERLHINNW